MDQQEQMKYFHEIFDPSMPRLGPGNDDLTIKALNILLSARLQRKHPRDAAKLRVLDIGCGNGGQTVQLAKHIEGSILAVDNHQPYLDELERRARSEGLSEKITPCLRDMRSLGMEQGAFDLIWAEGSLFVMGFREGLSACHDLLTSHGFLAASEVSWLRPDPPSECREFFANVYPVMADIDANLGVIRSCGFEVLGHFTFPESSWWAPYYLPMERHLRSLREKYATDPKGIEMIALIEMEIEIYRKYSNYYGNVFYLMQRN
jgi:SAM-dependent methyltransferase